MFLKPMFLKPVKDVKTNNRTAGLILGTDKIVKITPGDVISLVLLRLSRRSLAFYYEKVPGFTYSSLREYKPAVFFLF